MTIEIHLWTDGSVSVTRNGGPYNKWSEQRSDNGLLVTVEEPNGSDQE